MCGITGVVLVDPEANAVAELYEGLNMLQHRGQDAAGIITCKESRFYQKKTGGLVKDVFTKETISLLKGHVGIGHVRYPTAGTSTTAESQPFYVNSPFGIGFAHNGNITNHEELYEYITHTAHRHINTESDSELLLNLFAHQLQLTGKGVAQPEDIYSAVRKVNEMTKGGFACIAMITGFGLVCFRDPNGIRPLVLGKRANDDGTSDYIAASESACLDFLGYTCIGDVAPGEAVLLRSNGDFDRRSCVDTVQKRTPCIFEYVYFARPDAVIDGICVYQARLNMGEALAKKMQKNQAMVDEIDVVIPVPDTARVPALQLALTLGKMYREGFVKNRYVGRTFIMPGQKIRALAVRRKLNIMKSEFDGKVVLIVDDSIVRGTTCAEIIKMAREAGARKVFFASCAPEIRYPNVYGIDMPTSNELIANNRTTEEIQEAIGVDALIYQDLESLKECCTKINPEITDFDCSVFDGCYVTGVDADYLKDLAVSRSDLAKVKKNKANDSQEVGLHNH